MGAFLLVAPYSFIGRTAKHHRPLTCRRPAAQAVHSRDSVSYDFEVDVSAKEIVDTSQAQNIEDLEMAIHTMGPEQELSDEAIDRILRLLPRTDRYVVLHPLTVNESPEHIQTKQISVGSGSVVVTPIHEPGHWSLAIFELAHTQIRYFDPLGRSCSMQVQERLRAFAQRRLSQNCGLNWSKPVITEVSGLQQ